MVRKTRNKAGRIRTLCVSPINGSRLPCDVIELKQSIVGDCQSLTGVSSPYTAKIKNKGVSYLGEANTYLESLLCAVSVGDQDLVHEVVQGLVAPRLETVWVTGDNVYISDLDMT